MLALTCVAAIAYGTHLVRGRGSESARAVTAEVLDGTWELESVNGDPVGPSVDSVVLSQSVTFRDGKIKGETRLRAETEAATSALPFPDQTAARVTTDPLSREVTVRWGGSYKLHERGRIALHVGQAAYRVAAVLRLGPLRLDLDHDAVLTYRGTARYRPVGRASPGKTLASR